MGAKSRPPLANPREAPMTPPADCEIVLARPAQRVALENIFQLYVHDFSEQWSGLAHGELEEDGRFPPYLHLDAYWSEEGRVPLLVRRDGRLAGFALLDRLSHVGERVDRNMAEFFIARKHRRTGLGAAAVDAIFQRYPGVWETAVARRNLPALAFWRRVIGAHPLVADLAESDVRSSDWDGWVLRYRVNDAGAGAT
jgi:predicted acetyltransferase